MTIKSHYAALMKKNWIIYKRNPCSAACGIVTPLLLMFIMVWLRTKITPTSVDSTSLLKLTHPLYTIPLKNNQLDPVQSSRKLQDFFLFNNYTDIFGVGYDTMYDFQSPAYFYPSNCGNFLVDEVPNNIIAFVGQNSSVSLAVQTYLQTLFKDQKVLGQGLRPTFKWFESQESLFQYIGGKTYLKPDNGVCFGFEIQTSDPSNWSVNLYFDDQRLYGGNRIAGIPRQTDPVWSPNNRQPKLKPYEQYSLDGYSFVQNVIANALLKEVTGVDSASINLMSVPMQSDNLKIDKFTSLNIIFANLVAILYILPLYNMVFFIVKEKENRTKESMRMMGMSDLPYWLSWLTYYTLQNTMTATLAYLVLSINVFPNSNGFYIFAMIWLYGQSLFGEILAIQACFQKSKYAGIVASVFYFVLILVNLVFAGPSIAPVWVERLLCLIPQVNLYQFVYWIFSFESAQLGINSHDLYVSSDSFVPAIGFIYFVLDGLLWTLIGFYLEAVIKSEYGSTKHPCFMFMPSSYCRRRPVDQEEENEQLLVNDTMELEGINPANYEPAQADVTRQEAEGGYLRIQNLMKTYENGFKAVKGINLKIYQNQIFALLGQNGAGKSTTISILTGLIQKSKGLASVFNLDLFSQGDEVRKFMGVCPQHDILFDYLTPIEHLEIFYDFKGGNPASKNLEIVDLIRDVGLEEDQNKQAASLSGGNRRKLSVAIAMCGGSKLVLLDEPTAGMDLGARRALWDMLKNYKNDKIIILTTHYMDEADVLGDRIGIMAKGEMKCLGSSLFLKKKFGAGYKLTMVKASKDKNTALQPFIERYLGQVELISEISSEISFGVIDVENKFEDFFKEFDKNLGQLGVLSYGISISTLEEVFLHINKEFGLELKGKNSEVIDAENDDEQPQIEIDGPYAKNQERKVINGLNDSSADENSFLSSKATFLKITSDQESQQTQCLVNPSSVKANVKALLQKRLHLYKRDRVGLLCEVIVPFLMVFIGCCLTKIDLTKDSITRSLTPNSYPLPQQILMNEFNVVDSGAGNIAPATLFANFPDQQSDFTPIFNAANLSFVQFYNYTFAQRDLNGVSKFGAYQIYKADNISKQFSLNSFLNLTSQDVTAFFPQFVYQAILKTATGNSQFNFEVTTVPYPALDVLKERQAEGNSLEFVFMVGIGISLIPCAMISFILKEKQESLKHMQLISGMSLPAYWISNLVADVLKVYVPIVLIVLLSVAFGSNYPGVWVVFMILPWGLVPFTYLTSFMFTNDTNAQIMTLLLNFVVCVVLAVTVYFLQLIPETFAVGDKLRWYLCIFPNYCVMNALLWSSEGAKILAVRQSDLQLYPQLPEDLFAFKNLGGDVFMLLLHFVVDLGLVALIEVNAFDFIKRKFATVAPAPENSIEFDDDVSKEEERIANDKSEVVRVYKFRKVYQAKALCKKPFLAVQNISFGLDYGECFALLGVNGAGKSTTFKSLTAGVAPTNGEITIAGLNIASDFNAVRKLIGYCPQHDAIFPLMTVKEHLWFYAQLKGIPEICRQEEIDKAILNLNLTDHCDKTAGSLSGGNKRKLSVAMATLGNPPIILLDEPSAGMDPEARRFMWQVVANISQRDKNSAVIITTHSMEEAEALSTKMGIMIRGGIFQCFGSSQHIKSKFGSGFEMEIKIQKAAYKEMQEFAQQLGFVEGLDGRADLDNLTLRAKVRGVPMLLLDQIIAQGLGSDIYYEAAQGGNTVRVKNLVQYLFTLQAGLKVIEFLCEMFSKVELYEQCSDFFKMRIPKDGQTIGRLFGSIQARKEELKISEYSVSETSLEQIFQTFAHATSKQQVKSFVFTRNEKGLKLQ